jgi:O-antigen biosynthesis protein
MVLSLTNPSLVALEMMACGLPCVELASESMRASFPAESPLALASADPVAIADSLERLLDDDGLRARVSQEGIGLMADRTWSRAASEVLAGMRHALDRGRRDA